MTYTDQKKFRADYNKSQEKAMSMGVPGSVEVSPDVAFKFYADTLALEVKKQNAKGEAVPPFQIFGRLFLDDIDNRIALRAEPQLPPEMVGITIFEWQNLPPLKLDEWNMAINDTWVLAGVNSLQEFYPASPVNAKNILDSRFNPPLTIMGRELVGLALAGYQLADGHGVPGYGYRHRPGSENQAKNLSLIDYLNGLDTMIKTVGNAKSFFAMAGFGVIG